MPPDHLGAFEIVNTAKEIHMELRITPALEPVRFSISAKGIAARLQWLMDNSPFHQPQYTRATVAQIQAAAAESGRVVEIVPAKVLPFSRPHYVGSYFSIVDTK